MSRKAMVLSRMTTNRKICNYIAPDGSAPIADFINRLDIKLQKKIRAQLRQLENSSFSLQPPNVKAFRQSRHKGFYEIRTRIRQAVRIIFVVDSDGNIVLLHGFIKKSDRATERALETAGARQLALASGVAQLKEIIL